MIRDEATRPIVLAMRDQLVRNLPAHDKQAEARAIYDFAEQAVRYTDDGPGNDTGKGAPFVIQEFISGRRTPGDCVTQTLVVGSLARSLGIPVRLIVTGQDSAYRNYTHIYPELWINGTWQAADVTAATAADTAIKARAGLGYEHPHGTTKRYQVRGLDMITFALDTRPPRTPSVGSVAARRLTRMRRRAGLGAEETAAAPAKDEKAATTQELASKKGGSGSWISDALGIVTSIFGGIGAAAKNRAPRLEAQTRIVTQDQASAKLVEDTAQYQGKVLSDALFGSVMQEVTYIHAEAQTAASDYFANGTYGT